MKHILYIFLTLMSMAAYAQKQNRLSEMWSFPYNNNDSFEKIILSEGRTSHSFKSDGSYSFFTYDPHKQFTANGSGIYFYQPETDEIFVFVETSSASSPTASIESPQRYKTYFSITEKTDSSITISSIQGATDWKVGDNSALQVLNPTGSPSQTIILYRQQIPLVNNTNCDGLVYINFDIGELPVYTFNTYKRNYASNPDTLNFVYKAYPFGGDNFDDLSVMEEFLTIESRLGDDLNPYIMLQGAQSAEAARQNSRVQHTTNEWVRTHVKANLPIYTLAFRLIGDFDNDRLTIVLNEKTGEQAYISRNSRYMSFRPWESFIEDAKQLSFNGLQAYDNIYGNEIKIPESNKYGSILLVYQDWMQVQYHDGKKTSRCWIQWKDRKGMLITGIIYEFVR